MQVDKHIRRLDADLARFEADLKDKMEGSDFESPGTRGLKSKSGFSFCMPLIPIGFEDICAVTVSGVPALRALPCSWVP